MQQSILIVGLVIASLFFNKQGNAQNNMSLGPKLGVGHAWISGGENKYQPFGHVGITFSYSPIEHLGLGADLLYSVEGGESQTGTNIIITEADYLRIPMYVKYFFGNISDRLRPSVEIGPSIGFLIGGHRVVETIDKGEQLLRIPTNEIANDVDLGILAGAGVNYRIMAEIWLLADISYYQGLTNLYQNNIENGKNRNIGISLGVAFGVGRAKK